MTAACVAVVALVVPLVALACYSAGYHRGVLRWTFLPAFLVRRQAPPAEGSTVERDPQARVEHAIHSSRSRVEDWVAKTYPHLTRAERDDVVAEMEEKARVVL